MNVYVVVTYYDYDQDFNFDVHNIYYNYDDALDYITTHFDINPNNTEPKYVEKPGQNVYDVSVNDSYERVAIVWSKFFSGAPNQRRRDKI